MECPGCGNQMEEGLVHCKGSLYGGLYWAKEKGLLKSKGKEKMLKGSESKSPAYICKDCEITTFQYSDTGSDRRFWGL